ncbi:hypothetical protein quinque_008666 [Culex quinquefasciatus]
MEYDDYEEKEYLRDPVDIDYDPFANERVDTESIETHCGKDGNGSEDDRGKEVHEKGEPSQNRSHVLEITRPALVTAVQLQENDFSQHLATQVTDRRNEPRMIASL